MCTFWLVEALAREGQFEEARFLFERMLGYASPLGLYPEETGPTGQLTGNFLQAFTQLSPITSAFILDRAITRGRRQGRGAAPVLGSGLRQSGVPPNLVSEGRINVTLWSRRERARKVAASRDTAGPRLGRTPGSGCTPFASLIPAGR